MRIDFFKYENSLKFVTTSKNSILFIGSILIFSILFTFCNPEANFEVPMVKKQIVVDGWIEQDDYANVFLTYNTAYFSNLDSASFRALIATTAKVTLTDGENSEVLILTRDTNYFPPYMYKGNEIVGKTGKIYSLIIVDGNDTITAKTTILKPIKLDSIWFELLNPYDTLGYIKCAFQDNPNEKNYYRSFTFIKSKNQIFYPTLISIYNDSYFN
jgi:hypothetical protein